MKTTTRTSAMAAAAALIAVAAIVAPSQARAVDLRVEVDGRPVRLGSRHQAYLDRGVWMIPARPVLDTARVSNTWDVRRQELEVWALYDRLRVEVGSYTVIRSGGRRDVLSRAIAMHHGEPYAPVDFLETCLGKRSAYDRRNEVLSFGAPALHWRWGEWDRPGPGRDGWGRRYDPRGPRDDVRRYIPLTIDTPDRGYGRTIRISGRWGGSSVRIRVYRSNGSEAINRTAGIVNGRYFIKVTLSGDRYRVVVEGYDGRGVRERREKQLEVR